jgi:hypothetical protein
VDPDVYPWDEEINLAFAQLKQNLGKDDQARIKPQDFNAMLELDIATQRSLLNGKNGLSESLRTGDLDDPLISIPDHFELFDPRKPPQLWVEDKLEELLKQVFNVRRKVESSMSRNELIAYD